MFTAYELDNALESQYIYESMSLTSMDRTVDVGSESHVISVLDGKWGEEGDWQCSTYVVFKVDGRIFKKTGRYASHDGEYWDGPLVEVEPVEKTFIAYEEKPMSADYTLADVERALNDNEFYAWSDYLSKQYGDGWSSVGDWSDLAYEGEDNESRKVTIGGVEHTWNTDVNESGGEGHGERAFVVFSITAPSGETRTFRKEGYYASHYGTDWDGAFEEVEAFEKTVTDYRPIEKR